MEDWLSWCRLCASVEVSKDSLMNLDNDSIQIMKQHFSIDLCTGDDEFPIAVCADCLKFAIKLDSFSKQCIKVDKMFTHLVTVMIHGLTCKNLTDIRYEYGIELDSSECKSHIQNYVYSNNLLRPNPIEEIILPPDNGTVLSEPIIMSKPRRKRKSNNLNKNRVIRKMARKIEIKSIKEEDETNSSILEGDDRTTIREDNNPNGNNKWKRDFNCPVCLEPFPNPIVRGAHLKKEHSDIVRPYKCNDCPKEYNDEYKLNLHKIIHLPENEKPVHKCSLCDKSFSRRVGLYSHQQLVHISDRKFICEECGRSFHTNYRLKEHYLTHSEERSLQCSYCSKSFKNRQQVKIHEDTHSGTSYECKICGKILNTQRNLNGHLKVVHSDEKKYKCHLCNNEYKRNKALKRHIANNHLGKQVK